MTVIWHEVLPMTLVVQQVVLIRPQQEQKTSAWMIQNRHRLHPSMEPEWKEVLRLRTPAAAGSFD